MGSPAFMVLPGYMDCTTDSPPLARGGGCRVLLGGAPLLIGRVKELYDQQKYADCLPLIDRLRPQNGNDPQLIYYSAGCKMYAGDCESARREAKRIARQATKGSREDLQARVTGDNQKCPACGEWDSEAKWDPGMRWPEETKLKPGALVVRCKKCSAFWFKPPLVPSEKWAVELPKLNED